MVLKFWKKTLLCSVVSCLLTVGFTTNAFATTIVLDPGHGNATKTKKGAAYEPYKEEDLTLQLSQQIKDELSQVPDLKVELTRTTSDTDLTLQERADFAKSVGADYLISIHFNACENHDKNGTEIWTSAFGNHYKKGMALGSYILQQTTGLGLSCKNIRTRTGLNGDYYGIIRNGVNSGVTTIILEQCYLDNPTDRAFLENGTSALAHADALGIYNYLCTQ